MFTGPQISSIVNRVADSLDEMEVRINELPGFEQVFGHVDTLVLSSALLGLLSTGRIDPANAAFASFEEKGLIDEAGNPRSTSDSLKWAIADELSAREGWGE